MRTLPRIEDLHPELAARVVAVANAHEAAFPDRALVLIWAYRSPAEQLAAFRGGSSMIDGRASISLHNLLPSLAADLWVVEGGDRAPAIGLSAQVYDVDLWIDRPPREAGTTLRLRDRGVVRDYYEPMGRLAEAAGLEWGGRWRGLVDGPHVQVPAERRIELVQRALAAAGHSPGGFDGRWGPRSREAAEAAGRALGARTTPATSRAAKQLPIHPDLWRVLHGRTA